MQDSKHLMEQFVEFINTANEKLADELEITAYEGLRRIGPLADKHILVTGAAGGIGSAAVAIAHAQGALVTGLISRSEQEEAVRTLGATTVVISEKGRLPMLAAASLEGVICGRRR